MSESGSAVEHAAVYVERVRISNYRGTSSLEVELEPTLTVLVGRNNVGKSRILSALTLALGGRVADVDDFTVGSVKEPTVDVVLAPLPVEGSNEEAFPDLLGPVLGNGAQAISESPFRERFAWRARIRRSAEGLGARSEFKVLTWDVASGDWYESDRAVDLSRAQRHLVGADLVNTGRDLLEELGRRGSSVRKVLSDLGVPDPTRGDLENKLSNLSAEIVSGSSTLASVTDALAALNQTVGSIGAPAINPLPLSLEELARSLSIDLDSGVGGAMPIRFHGAGARSLASLQIQGVLYERLLGADGGRLRPHPVTLVEEPEAHLHPQACAEIPHLLGRIRGQVIASTHSAQVVTAAETDSLRLLRSSPAGHLVIDLKPFADGTATHRLRRPELHADEVAKLKRQVERPFGELLFANAIVIGDGATERAFLPPVIRHALAGSGHGVCVIDPESMTTDMAKAAAKFAKVADIPWLLFADSDDVGRRAVADLLRAVGQDPDSEDHVVWAGKPRASDSGEFVDAIEAMLVDFDEGLARAACEAIRPGSATNKPVLKAMKSFKGSVGATLADMFVGKYPDVNDWPAPLQQLVTRLREELT